MLLNNLAIKIEKVTLSHFENMSNGGMYANTQRMPHGTCLRSSLFNSTDWIVVMKVKGMYLRTTQYKPGTTGCGHNTQRVIQT